MTPGEPGGLATAAELRRAFDRTFAEAPSVYEGALEDLLHIRLGRMGYAIRVTEISGLFAAVKVTPVPSGLPELLGICGIRGVILPVYALGALLGYPPEPDPRWLVIGGAGSVALAFAAFEGQVRAGKEAVAPHDGTAMEHVREVVRVQGGVRPILSMASIREAITARVRAAGSQQE